MGWDGSMEYSLTWKERVTPAGRRICALRASGRRTSGKGYGGSQRSLATHKEITLWKAGLVTPQTLAGWSTPRANDAEKRGCPSEDKRNGLVNAAQLAGRPTPNAMLGGSTNRSGKRKGELLMGGLVRGLTSCSSPAATARCAGSALNPAMSRWLQGYPATFDRCAPHWKEWDTVQKKLAECSGDREAFLPWLVKIALAG